MSRERNLVIFGTGQMGKLAHHYFTRDSDYEVVGFTVDGRYLERTEFLGLKVTPWEEAPQVFPPDEITLFVALSYASMNSIRQGKFDDARSRGYVLASYVSSRCSYLSDEPVGANCFILEDNTIQPFVSIGDNVTLWSGNHIGHDAVIQDHCFVTSHVVISGNVVLGHHSFLGVNSTIRDSVSVAPRTLVGAGAIITSDTEEGGVYVPARSVKLGKTSDEMGL
jgi:sugar O-acyltransferase (sialic acid O-acetyltransferase NeuD family)